MYRDQNKEQKYILLFLVLFTIFSFKYYLLSFVSYQFIQNDSVYNSHLAYSIAKNGTAKWVIDFFSIFGLYPLSEPSANPFLTASLSLLTNLEIEYSVLLLDFFLSFFVFFSVFVLSREFNKNYLFALITAFSYITSLEFILYSTWMNSARLLLFSLTPIFLFLLLKSINKDGFNLKYFILFLFVFFTVLASHRAGIILIIILFLYLLTLLFFKLALKIKNRIKNRNFLKFVQTNKFLILQIIIIIGIFIGLFLYSIYSSEQFFRERRDWWKIVGVNFSQLNLFDTIKEIGSTFFVRVGLLSFFAIIGFFYVISRKEKKVIEFFLVIYLMIFALLLVDYIYSILIFLLPVSLFISYGVIFLKEILFDKKPSDKSNLLYVFFRNIYSIISNSKNNRISFGRDNLIMKRVFSFFIILIFASSLFFTSIKLSWDENPNLTQAGNGWIQEDVYESSLFVKYNSANNSFINHYQVGEIVMYVSDSFLIPSRNGELIIYGFVQEHELKKNITQGDFMKIWKDKSLYTTRKDYSSLNDATIYATKNYNDKLHVNVAKKYDIAYFIGYNKDDKFKYYGAGYNTTFAKYVLKNTYCIYKNDVMSIYYTGG